TRGGSASPPRSGDSPESHGSCRYIGQSLPAANAGAEGCCSPAARKPAAPHRTVPFTNWRLVRGPSDGFASRMRADNVGKWSDFGERDGHPRKFVTRWLEYRGQPPLFNIRSSVHARLCDSYVPRNGRAVVRQRGRREIDLPGAADTDRRGRP